MIHNLKPEITPKEVYRLLGDQSGARLSGKVTDRVTRAICRANGIINPKILFSERDIQKMGHDTLRLNEDIMLKSRHLVQAFHGCEKIVLFLVTIGIEWDLEIKSLMNHGRMAEAYIWDAVGSVAVEGAIQGFQDMMDERLESHGKKTTIRFSPGYCDWRLEEQKKLFRILPHDMIGVTLSPGCLMSPRKSISGSFGIGDQRHMNPSRNNPCHVCTMQTCTARRADRRIQAEVR